MSPLFRNSSPGALTLEQAIELELKRLRARRRAKQQAESAPEQGDDFTGAEDAVPEEPDENHRDLWTHTPGTLFRNDSPGAPTLDQAVEIEQKRMATRRKAKQQVEQAAQQPQERNDDFTIPPGGILGGFNPRRNREYLASFGRGQDTEVAHVARGELVVPRILQSPEVLAVLSRAAAAHNVPLKMLSVGNALNHINPATGAPEFGIMDWISGLFGNHPPQGGSPDSSATTIPDPKINETNVIPTNESLGYDPQGHGELFMKFRHPWDAMSVNDAALQAQAEEKERYGANTADSEGDAWRHARWNQLMSASIGPQMAKEFSDAHERSVPDPYDNSRLMDLYNNQVGRTLPNDPYGHMDPQLALQNALRNGYLRKTPF